VVVLGGVESTEHFFQQSFFLSLDLCHRHHHRPRQCLIVVIDSLSKMNFFTPSPPRTTSTTTRHSPRFSPPSGLSTSTASPTAPVVPAFQAVRPRTLNEIIKYKLFYMDRDVFFNLLQDEGIPMSPSDIDAYNPEIAKAKRKAKHISFHDPVHGLRFYPDLYVLSGHIWDKLCNHRVDFPQLPKGGTNKSTYLHDIGKIIASARKEYALADVHSIGDEGEESIVDLIASVNKPSVFTLRQSTLLSLLHEAYGPLPENKKTTVDDKVRVMGLIFKSELLRDMLPDMLDKTRGGPRAAVDAASSRKRAGFNGLFNDFVDSEKIVTLPAVWLRGSTKMKVNNSKGSLAYEEYGVFNPNNKNRIALPWTEKEVAQIFNSVMTEYKPAMHNWMKGTGGGSGAPEDFSIWENRDPVLFVNYSNQATRIYLSVIYMWDKEFGFPLVTKKASVPTNAAVDDNVLFRSYGHDDEDNNGNETGSSSEKRGRRTASARKEDSMMSILQTMNQMNKEANAVSTQLLDTIRGVNAPVTATASAPSKSSSNSTNDNVAQLMDHMRQTDNYLEETKEKLNTLLGKRKSLSASSDDEHKNSKLIRKLNEEINDQKLTMNALKKAKQTHRSKLIQLCKSNSDDSDGECDSNEGDDNGEE